MSIKDVTDIAKSATPQEIAEVRTQVADAASQGKDACDELDLLMTVLDKAEEVVDAFGLKRSYVRQRLIDLSMKL